MLSWKYLGTNLRTSFPTCLDKHSFSVHVLVTDLPCMSWVCHQRNPSRNVHVLLERYLFASTPPAGCFLLRDGYFLLGAHFDQGSLSRLSVKLGIMSVAMSCERQSLGRWQHGWSFVWISTLLSDLWKFLLMSMYLFLGIDEASGVWLQLVMLACRIWWS